jgi:peroxiredoxin
VKVVNSFAVHNAGINQGSRSVFVVDRDGLIQYVGIVKELKEQPDDEAVLDVVNKLV